ncbi:MAG: hypothetical protein Q9216_000881 [Gyalolechia sp. 2 TL-2023]
MKTDFKFSNLLGTVYCKGNLVFTPDGNSLLSPVGNRVSVFDLSQNSSYTLPLSHRRNISCLALAPDGKLLLTVDDDGQAVLTYLPRRLTLHHLSLKAPVIALAISPSGRYFAAGVGRQVEIWHVPSVPSSTLVEGLEFAPFVRHRLHTGHHDVVQRLEWSNDSRYLLSSARDLTVRVWSVSSQEGFTPTTLAGHKEAVVGAWFSADQEVITTVSQDGALFEWQYIPLRDGAVEHDYASNENAPSSWRITRRHYFNQKNAKLSCATYHSSSNLFVSGFSNGLFSIYELPDFNLIHTLSISQQGIDDIAINHSGDWLALGAAKLGQLLVWDWQSESYILKQQGHFDSINDLVYAREGHRVVTAADDGKVKIWDIRSGFCIVTFTEHSSGVTACKFAQKGNVLFTASLDGSVRAWDLIRYRNFRTFSAPTRLSFSSLAVDPSGDVVCAGSHSSSNIHIWSVQTGQLLDQLAGHEGPVSSLVFAPSGGTLVSGSWDHTIRIWNIFDRTQSSEALHLQSDITAVSIRPDSKQIAVSTLHGQLTFWSITEPTQSAGIDSRRDVSGGRKLGERRTATNAAGSKNFNCLSYSLDGSCIIAGGNSKYLCLYDVLTGSLLKKYTVSVNMSLEGTQEYLNSRTLTEAGPAGSLNGEAGSSVIEDRILPGSGRGDFSSRRVRPEVRVTAVAFSPTGRAFCAASTEGLLVYSLDHAWHFDPLDLDVDITRASVLTSLKERQYLRALIMGFCLNESSLLQRIFEAIPLTEIRRLVKELPTVHLTRLIRLVAQTTDASPHLEKNLRWIESLLSLHGPHVKEHVTAISQELRVTQRVIGAIQTDLIRVADENAYVLDYILGQPASKPEASKAVATDGYHGVLKT